MKPIQTYGVTMPELVGLWTEPGNGLPSSHIVLKGKPYMRLMNGRKYVLIATVCGRDASVDRDRLGRAPQGRACGACLASDQRHFGRSWPAQNG